MKNCTALRVLLSYDRLFVSTYRGGKACSNEIFLFLKLLEFDQFYKKNLSHTEFHWLLSIGKFYKIFGTAY